MFGDQDATQQSEEQSPSPFTAPKPGAQPASAAPSPAVAPGPPAAPGQGSPAAVNALFGNMYADATPNRQGAATGTASAAPAPAAKQQIPHDDMTPKQVQAAAAWAAHENLDPGAITQLQAAVGAPATGIYDEATIHAVYQKQRQWTPKGAIAAAGQASAAVFQHLGLVYVHKTQNAAVSDAVLKQVQQLFPSGVSVAIYADLKNKTANNLEFSVQANIFAKNHHCVGLSGSNAVLGVPVPIKELGEVINTVQGIHGGLLAMYEKSQPAGAPKEATPPAFTQVKNLALFCHGEPWGMGMNENNDFSNGGLHNTQRGPNPANIQSFVKGLSGAVAPDVRVSLFACSTGRDNHAETGNDWLDHKQGQREGQNSMAASLSNDLGPQASVWAHTTAGHTTENYAARVFGADSGASGQGGLQGFDIMYPESFIQSEVTRLYPEATGAQRSKLHDSLREQMWKQYQDSITGEQGRPAKSKRYPVPIGQEMFSNPDHARELIQADWKNYWVPTHVKPSH